MSEQTAKQQKTMGYYAQKYAARGFAVFPLKPRGKEPLTKSGCLDATVDSAQVEQWWGRWPTANIGIATGKASGGLVVIDVDVDNERGIYGNESLRLWESEFSPLPSTMMTITGRGGTHYFFHSISEVRNRTNVLEGVDVRGEGGYIVAPPSIHPNGQSYEWEASSTPVPAELSEDLLFLILGQSGTAQQAFTMPEAVIHGARNDTLFRLSSSLQAKGLSDQAILQAALAENTARCIPPLSDAEVQVIVASATRYQKGESREAQEATAIQAADTATRAPDVVTLLSERTFEAVFAIKDVFEREQKTSLLRERARELKVLRDFNALIVAYRKRRVQAQKQKDSNIIGFTDAPLTGLKCGDWICDDLGIRRIVMDGDESKSEVACTHPVLPVERLTNAETGTEKLKIAFCKDSTWQSVVVDRSAVASRQNIIKLADRGIQVTSENARLMVQFLCDVESLNLDKIPAYQSIGRLGWVGENFSPYVDCLRFDGALEYRDYFESVSTEGSYDAWFRMMLQVRRDGSIPARIVLAGSYASPIVQLLGKLPFIIHLWGGSEAGKTVAQMVAASVWGNPALGKLTRSLNSTGVALERAASFCCNVPLVLDELQTILKSKKDFDSIIYNLAEGQGRGRGTQGGGLQYLSQWRLCSLTSGECPITSNASGGGAKNRVIEIECTEKLFPDAVSVVNCAQQHYGHGGQRYIELLQNKDTLEELQGRYSDSYITLIDAGATEKQSMAAALCLAADGITTKYIFGDGACLEPGDILPYLSTTKDIDVGERAYQWIVSWIASNCSHFEAGTFTDPWGAIRASRGFAEGFIIIAQVLRDALDEAGFSYQSVLSALARDGKIRGSGGKNTIDFRIGSIHARCVYLVMCDEQGYTEISPEDSPL